MTSKMRRCLERIIGASGVGAMLCGIDIMVWGFGGSLRYTEVFLGLSDIGYGVFCLGVVFYMIMYRKARESELRAVEEAGAAKAAEASVREMAETIFAAMEERMAEEKEEMMTNWENERKSQLKEREQWKEDMMAYLYNEIWDQLIPLQGGPGRRSEERS